MNRPRLLALLAALALTTLLAPAAASAETQLGVNQTPITINDDAPASPYPSAIDIAGMQGRVTDVYVSVKGLSHSTPGDIDMLLVAPSGRASVLMSDACVGQYLPSRTITFHQQAAQPMPQVGSCAEQFFYRPSNYETSPESWVDAPQARHPTDLDTFIGDDPNGTWRLMILDDDDNYTGRVANGWSLVVETKVPTAELPGTLTKTVSGLDGVVTDVDVTLSGLFHERPRDLDVLLVGPGGRHVMLMSDACGEWLAKRAEWAWSATGGTPMAGPFAPCFGGSPFSPTDHDPAEQALPAPAPPGPYETDLTAFDLTDPNGEWKLYVADDDPSTGTGFLTDELRLDIETRPGADVTFDDDNLTLDEGTSGLLELTRTSADQRLGAGSVTVTSTPRTATSGTDFEPVTRTVAFGAGEARKSIPVAALADALPEDAEAFTVTVGGARGDARPGAGSQATVTVADVAPREDVKPTGSSVDPGADRGPDGAPADRVAPVVGAVRVRRGRTIRFSLSEPAAVTLRVLRRVGRRTRVARTLRVAGRAGANRVVLPRRAIRRGRYRVRVTAVDAAGNRSAPRTRSFRAGR